MRKRPEEIAADLRTRIQEELIAPGTRLPDEDALAARYRADPPAVRQALRVLQAEGLIEGRPGGRTFVRPVQQFIEYRDTRCWWSSGSTQWDSRRGTRSGACDVEVIVTHCALAANSELSSCLGVEPGTRLLESISRSRRIGTENLHSHVRSYVVYDQVHAASVLPDCSRLPSADAYRNRLARSGITVDRIVERLFARPSSPAEAKELGLVPGAVVLAVQRTSYDPAGHAVETADLLMAGDRVTAEYTTYPDPAVPLW
ncbi:GntR family transcriptional regulator [Streptomyces gamaensis]|uniref:GntR family transcriptional regulator n=1 Tax=Streptomyces gamaensis TaxID=1763542 RepID=A0ABW0YZX8_9ACTN